MAGDPETDVVGFLARFLVAYRVLLYLGALLAMSAPLFAAHAFHVSLPQSVRRTVVAVSFAVLVLTYLAERRVGLDHVDPATGAPRERYSRRIRFSVVLAIAGVAVGLYLVFERNVAAGLFFLGGSMLFFQQAFRAERGDVEDAGG